MEKNNTEEPISGEQPIVLTPLHWAVYDALIAFHDYDPNRATVSQRDLCDAVNYTMRRKGYADRLNYRPTVQNGGEGRNHDGCSRLWQIIDDLNNSPRVDKIIISKNYTYHIANRKEAEAYHMSLIDKLVKYRDRAKIVFDKVQRDGQGKIVNNADKPIREGNKQFYETFFKEGNKDD